MDDVAELHQQALLAQDRAYACRILGQRLATYETRSRRVAEPVRTLHTSAVWTGSAAEASRYWLGTTEYRLLLLQREIDEVRAALSRAATQHEHDALRFLDARDAAERDAEQRSIGS